MTNKYNLITALMLLTLVPIVQVANAASIEVPTYDFNDIIPEFGPATNGTQFIEYPDGQSKVQIPYKDEDKKAWINVEAYNMRPTHLLDLRR